MSPERSVTYVSERTLRKPDTRSQALPVIFPCILFHNSALIWCSIKLRALFHGRDHLAPATRVVEPSSARTAQNSDTRLRYLRQRTQWQDARSPRDPQHQ